LSRLDLLAASITARDPEPDMRHGEHADNENALGFAPHGAGRNWGAKPSCVKTIPHCLLA